MSVMLNLTHIVTVTDAPQPSNTTTISRHWWRKWSLWHSLAAGIRQTLHVAFKALLTTKTTSSCHPALAGLLPTWPKTFRGCHWQEGWSCQDTPSATCANVVSAALGLLCQRQRKPVLLHKPYQGAHHFQPNTAYPCSSSTNWPGLHKRTPRSWRERHSQERNTVKILANWATCLLSPNTDPELQNYLCRPTPMVPWQPARLAWRGPCKVAGRTATSAVHPGACPLAHSGYAPTL